MSGMGAAGSYARASQPSPQHRALSAPSGGLGSAPLRLAPELDAAAPVCFGGGTWRLVAAAGGYEGRYKSLLLAHDSAEGAVHVALPERTEWGASDGAFYFRCGRSLGEIDVHVGFGDGRKKRDEHGDMPPRATYEAALKGARVALDRGVTSWGESLRWMLHAAADGSVAVAHTGHEDTPYRLLLLSDGGVAFTDSCGAPHILNPSAELLESRWANELHDMREVIIDVLNRSPAGNEHGAKTPVLLEPAEADALLKQLRAQLGELETQAAESRAQQAAVAARLAAVAPLEAFDELRAAFEELRGSVQVGARGGAALVERVAELELTSRDQRVLIRTLKAEITEISDELAKQYLQVNRRQVSAASLLLNLHLTFLHLSAAEAAADLKALQELLDEMHTTHLEVAKIKTTFAMFRAATNARLQKLED